MALSMHTASTFAFLDDPDIADTPHTFYRRGTKGHLHANPNCWYVVGKELNHVRLTWREAAKKPVCSYGCVSRYQPDELRAAVTLEAADEMVAEAHADMQTGGHADLSTAMGLLEHAQQYLEETPQDGVASAHRRLWDAIEREKATLRSLVARHGTSLLQEIAADLNEVNFGRNPRGAGTGHPVPHCTDDINRRIGTKGRARGDITLMIYSAWQASRKTHDADHARQCAHEPLQYSELTSVDQLEGITLHNVSGDAGAIALRTWKEAITRDVNHLVDTWEQQYQENLADQDMTVMGILADHWVVREDCLVILQAFPHARHRNQLVGAYPALVTNWISGVLDRHGVTMSVHHGPVTSTELETVAVLWDPSPNGEGAYRTVSQAIAAAQLL